MPNSVIFFVSPNCGGAEKVSISYAETLLENGIDVMVVIIGRQIGNIIDIIPSVLTVRFIHIYNIYDFTTLKIARLLIQERPKWVFCSLFYLNIRVAKAARLVGNIKIALRCSSTSFNKYYNKLFIHFIRKSFLCADLVIAQTNEMKKEMVKELTLPEEDITVIYNPIDKINILLKAHAPSPFHNSSVKYVAVGRIVHQKAYDILIDAFASLCKNNDCELYIVGATSDTKEVERISNRIHYHNIQERVYLVGFESNPYKWIFNADCLVLSSKTEGLPNVLIEASFLGKRLVSTDCVPVVREIITNGINGYVVPIENSQKLATAMHNVLGISEPTNFSYQPCSKSTIISLFQ